MHEIINFAKGIFKNLGQAIKTDIDVFLITFAGLLWPFKLLRGLSISTLVYVVSRRVDGLMSAFVIIKQQEIHRNSDAQTKK